MHMNFKDFFGNKMAEITENKICIGYWPYVETIELIRRIFDIYGSSFLLNTMYTSIFFFFNKFIAIR